MLPKAESASGPLRIVTNFERFPSSWSLPTGEFGTARFAGSFTEFVRGLREGDLALVDGDVRVVLGLCVYWSVFPAGRKLLIPVDLVMGMIPLSPAARIKSAVTKLLFRRVDRFINYFKCSEDYARLYGITPERSSFVPFKPNIRYRCDAPTDPDGDYVLCFGRSRRDYDTFFSAVERLPYPAAIPRPDVKRLQTNGSRFTRPLDQLPPQLSLLDDDGSQDAMVRIIGGARVVVLPMLPSNLLAGIGVYLNAMLLGKCVIITAGAGATDVLTDQALFVPPGDPEKLARLIQLAWEDNDLRLRTAESGLRYARSLGGQPELYQRILRAVAAWARSDETIAAHAGEA